MRISTRGRYALRVMIDLAEHYNGNYIPLKDIAARQEISLKYLESIMSDLSKSSMLDGQHGKGGGYKLNRLPEEYSVGEITYHRGRSCADRLFGFQRAALRSRSRM